MTAPRSPSVAPRGSFGDEEFQDERGASAAGLRLPAPGARGGFAFCLTGVIQRLEPMEKGQAERLVSAGGSAGRSRSQLVRPEGAGGRHRTGQLHRRAHLVAAARGLALGLGIPAIGVTRLEALAYGLPRPAPLSSRTRDAARPMSSSSPPAAPERRIWPTSWCPPAPQRVRRQATKPFPRPCRWPKPSRASPPPTPDRPNPAPPP